MSNTSASLSIQVFKQKELKAVALSKTITVKSIKRLDRLLLILETGSTPATRKTAAKQLGEVQKFHPHELTNLLARVHVYLKSKNWDTRIAASQAIEAICQHVQQWNPDGVKIKDDQASQSSQTVADGKLNFNEFDISVVLEKGEKLLGSAGDEFDVEDDASIAGLSQKEIIAQQRQALRKKLGFGMLGGVDMGMEGLFEDSDLISSPEKQMKKQSSTENAAEIVASQIAAISSDSGLSSREKNRAKRKAKSFAKQKSKEQESKSFDNHHESTPPAEKRQRRTQSVFVEQPREDKVLIDKVNDNTVSLDEMTEWPFECFCAELCNDLFNPSWEVRHGAASGLREILKQHGSSAGKTKATPVTRMLDANIEWLEDTALKLLCVFALDRFGDFVSDEVVAPVRETCAQTLGSVLHHMTSECVNKVLVILLKLQSYDQWQVRHGGLLGLKYMLAVRKDMGLELLPNVLPWILNGLQDGDDDVRAVAADALLPVADLLGTGFPDEVPNILTILWDILLELDDLTSSTNSVMNLLSSLITVNVSPVNVNFHELVPRLFPFFKHTITSVRLSALKTLKVLLETSKDSPWLQAILYDQLRQIYQRIILEPNEDIRKLATLVWSLTVSKVPTKVLEQSVQILSPTWFRLLVHPGGIPIDGSLLTYESGGGGLTMKKGKGASENHGQIFYVGSVDSTMDTQTKNSLVIQVRLAASSAIGELISLFSMDQTTQGILNYLLAGIDSLVSSNSSVQQMCGSMVLQEWAKISKTSLSCPDSLVMKLQNTLSSQVMYEELLVLHQRLQIDTQTLINFLKEQSIDLTPSLPQTGIINLDIASLVANQIFQENMTKIPSKKIQIGESKRKTLLATINELQTQFQVMQIRVLSSIAASLISLNKLTAKLNPIIRPIMDSVKREEDLEMQKRTAVALSQLLSLCLKREPCPNNKIVKNLCTFVCNDSQQTPSVNITPVIQNGNVSNSKTCTESEICDCDIKYGILTLQRKQKEALRATTKRTRLARNNSNQPKELDGVDSNILNTQDNEENVKMLQVQRKGAETALTTCAVEMGASLPTVLPYLWETIHTTLQQKVPDPGNLVGISEDDIKQLITSMQVLEIVASNLQESLTERLKDILHNLFKCLHYPYTSVRHMAARCLGKLGKIITSDTMNIVLTKVADVLGQSDNIIGRQGAIETLVCVIDNLGMDILPYIVLLIVPVLGRMSDQKEDIRLMATNCFATLVQLMPLEAGVPDPISMSKELIQKKIAERRFLEQLLDGKKLDKFSIPIPIKCDLRKYQQDGVNWLAFLKKYNLHGILCDDMGLGKTLQSICIMASDYYNLMKKYKISGKEEFKPLPSLVVCPPTLTGHWCYEIEKFCNKDHVNPLHYTGSPGERSRLQMNFKNHNVVVASYDIIRNDNDFFLLKDWNYCILDEGHIIKNSKTKLSRVIKKIRAKHRLILSGTPIQNNVLELWSLFDFLMPGFLGTEREFTAKFGRPILQSRDAKSSSKEQEAGALAMEALHKQTLPFLLRRVKEDVLQDLPPKIIQDYYCDLSPLQLKLYEDFSKSQARKNIDDSVQSENDEKKSSGHIFQALQYLRKVSNHPSLVLKPTHPEYQEISANLQQAKSPISDIQHSGKLVALRQLLLDCGIGVTDSSNSNDDALNSAVVSQHRALVFCQLKSMLDLVENTLLKANMPTVTYTRLDGSVPAGTRHSIVQRFNNDPSIDLLLLTTHVGGLGLNLTGADTVIFVEHDWNPMKDLQAMDRAHRIGQKKVVNVYRLIARGTLEEKIMGLQKFKLNIANTVITQDNSSLQSMDTSQLFDLFNADSGKQEKKKADDNKPSSAKSILENMEELWDSSQYEDEYNLDNFMGSLM